MRAAFTIIGLVLLVLILCGGGVSLLEWFSPSASPVTHAYQGQFLLFTHEHGWYCVWYRFDSFAEGRDIELRLNALYHDQRTFYITDTKRLTPPAVPETV